MREIKFRAWYANQEMHYGIAPIDNKYYIFFETQKRNAHDLQINRAISIMQYTGLKDKNGKDIYEGDIVKHATDEGVYKVIFEDGGFYVKNLFEYDFQTINEYPLEVIGNIYENPELLEEVSE